MYLLFNASAHLVDVGIVFIQGFICFCWIAVIYRVVSLGDQLDILPLPSSFPHYPYFSSASTTKQHWLSLGGKALFFISLIEVFFSLYYFYLIRRVQVQPSQLLGPFERMKELYLRALSNGLETVPSTERVITLGKSLPAINFPLDSLPLNHPKAKDFRDNQTVWFQNCRWEEIYRENYREWLCIFIFNKTLKQVEEEYELKPKEASLQEVLEELVIAYERRVGTRMRDGYNESLKDRVIQLPKDPIKVSMRPLTLTYGFAWSTNELVRQIMKWNGFVPNQCFNRKNGLKYLIRIPQSWSQLPIEKRSPPIIFIHGLGSGLFLYNALLKFLTFSDWSKERPVMVLIQPHISMQIYSPAYLFPPNRTQIEGDMKEVFDGLGFNHTGVELLAHSNGTVVAGWIIKYFPRLIKRCCFLDPVCFALWEGHACYNFLYSKPKTGLEKILRFGLAEELGIALYTRRHFHWPEAVLWPEEIPGFRDPKRFKVVLGGKDAIINANRIRGYLSEAGMLEDPRGECNGKHVGGILFDPDGAHGETITFGHPFLDKIVRWLQRDEDDGPNVI